MTRNEMLQRLQIIKTELELIEVAATVGLKAYAGEAVGLTMAAVCHAIDLVSISEEVKVGGMTINQLYEHCLDALDRGDRVIVLVTDWVRLLKTRGPIGELRCVNAQGKKVVAFDAEKVLMFCKKEMSGK